MRTAKNQQKEEIPLTTLRSSFTRLCCEFPSLSISMTLSEKYAYLTIDDNQGGEHSICLENLLNDTNNGIYEIIFNIKEVIKKYDA